MIFFYKSQKNDSFFSLRLRKQLNKYNKQSKEKKNPYKMSYFTRDETTMLKMILTEEEIPLKFNPDAEITGKFAEKYESFKDCSTWAGFLEAGGVFADLSRCLKSGDLEIDFENWDDCQNAIENAKERHIEKMKMKEEEKKQKAIQKAEEKEAAKILKEKNKLDRAEAKKVVKIAKDALKVYNSEMKKSKSSHKRQLKQVLKPMKKLAKEWRKNVDLRVKMDAKALKADLRATKEAIREAKKLLRELKKQEKKNEEEQKQNIVIEDSEDEVQNLSPDVINNMKVADLKNELKKLGCDDVTGKKADLRERLLEMIE